MVWEGRRRFCCWARRGDGREGLGWKNLCGNTCGGTELLGCGGGGCSERGRDDGQHQISRDHWQDYNSKLTFSMLYIIGYKN